MTNLIVNATGSLKKLPRSFYDRDTIEVAKELLGCYLVYKTADVERIGKIVEVEAYVGPHDLACHASKGVTKRTEVMYGAPGFAYVYLIYGMYYCMNVVTEKIGHGSAVLLRALEPILNISERTTGPGLLTRAMGIDKHLNRQDLVSNYFYIAQYDEKPTFSIVERPRIGVHYAKEWAEKPLRFYIEGNPYISKK